MSSTFGRSDKSFKTEALEELARRAVQERSADDLLAADDLHELPLHQRAEHAAAFTPRISATSGEVTGCL